MIALYLFAYIAFVFFNSFEKLHQNDSSVSIQHSNLIKLAIEMFNVYLLDLSPPIVYEILHQSWFETLGYCFC